jgi:hypothetical protein
MDLSTNSRLRVPAECSSHDVVQVNDHVVYCCWVNSKSLCMRAARTLDDHVSAPTGTAGEPLLILRANVPSGSSDASTESEYAVYE